ncbi:hypothetical protein [Cereibacter sphaeroides]|nr:hypothetical protein [Cereibacter sphaeroides]
MIEILDPAGFRIRDHGGLLAAGSTQDVYRAMPFVGTSAPAR